jgi:muconolactone D-isomerase
MEFLVRIEIDLPADMPEPRRRDLMDAEARRGRELLESGALVRIWRVPGRFANVSLYETADATELHVALSSLPLHPWMHVDVEPLAVHPLESSERGASHAA